MPIYWKMRINSLLRAFDYWGHKLIYIINDIFTAVMENQYGSRIGKCCAVGDLQGVGCT